MDSEANVGLTKLEKRKTRPRDPDPNFDYPMRRTPRRKTETPKKRNLNISIICVRPGQENVRQLQLDKLKAEGWGVPKAANKAGKCSIPLSMTAAEFECFIRWQFPQLGSYELLKCGENMALTVIPAHINIPAKIESHVSRGSLYIRPVPDVKPAITVTCKKATSQRKVNQESVLTLCDENFQKINDLISESLRNLLCSSIAFTKHITLNAALSLGVDSEREIDISIEEIWMRLSNPQEEEEKKQKKSQRKRKKVPEKWTAIAKKPIVICPQTEHGVIDLPSTEAVEEPKDVRNSATKDGENVKSFDQMGLIETVNEVPPLEQTTEDVFSPFAATEGGPGIMKSEENADDVFGPADKTFTANGEEVLRSESGIEQGISAEMTKLEDVGEDIKEDNDDDSLPPLSDMSTVTDSDSEDTIKPKVQQKRKRADKDSDYLPSERVGKQRQRIRQRKIKKGSITRMPVSRKTYKVRKPREPKELLNQDRQAEEGQGTLKKESKKKAAGEGKQRSRLNKQMTLEELEFMKDLYTLLIPSKIRKRPPRKRKESLVKKKAEEGLEKTKELSAVTPPEGGSVVALPKEGAEVSQAVKGMMAAELEEGAAVSPAEVGAVVPPPEESSAEVTLARDGNLAAITDGILNAEEDPNHPQDERLFSPQRLEKYGEDYDTAIANVRLNKMKARNAAEMFNIPYDVLCEEVNKTRFQCNICNNRFAAPCHLRRHLSMHVEGRNFKCDHCEKRFNCIENLRRHQVVHNTKHEHVCETCGETFLWKASLTRHLMKHRGERPHTCSVCSKTFITIYDLKSHMHLHTGIRDFICSECGMMFARSSGLNAHMRTTHTELRTFECTECGKSFKMKHALARHMRNHTGKEVYTCDICGKGFKWFTSRKLHMKKHGTEEANEKPHIDPPHQVEFHTVAQPGLKLQSLQIGPSDPDAEANGVQQTFAIRMHQLIDTDAALTDDATQGLMESVVLTPQGDLIPRVTVAQMPVLEGNTTTTVLTPTIIEPIIMRQAHDSEQKTYIDYHTLKSMGSDTNIGGGLGPQE